MLAQDLTAAVTRGRPWLGHRVLEPLKVLYSDAENGDALALRRLRRLGVRSDLRDRLIYSTELLDFGRDSDLGRLQVTLEGFRPDLVVVDTLASHSSSAEADTESMARFYRDVWFRVRAAGSAMVLLHHLRKSVQGSSRDDPLDSFRGSGHITGVASRVWLLDAIAPGPPVFVLRDVKAREFPACDPVRIRIIDDGEGSDAPLRLDVEGTVAQVETDYDRYLGMALSFIDAHPLQLARTADLISLPGAPAERTAKDYLSRALATGVLHKRRRGYYGRAEADVNGSLRPEDAA
jgi:hypothetical protein